MIICRFQGLVRENIVVDGIIKGVPLPVDALSGGAASRTAAVNSATVSDGGASAAGAE
jgi:hypothetical protein